MHLVVIIYNNLYINEIFSLQTQCLSLVSKNSSSIRSSSAVSPSYLRCKSAPSIGQV